MKIWMQNWMQNWDAISSIFKFSTAIKKVIHTTNAIESQMPLTTS
ncbi:hypothetical protein CLOBOL_05624 [Enterocloster bolteae ATCC BAA-613]|uniref:Uncharacterized protein n=1 Tax=Enterocloster bolteae (strain ATCC BAA-613 / DSM 15670 / CCUG 46953 / JCM 12243 / WAL 16351) TaxID=411902 RepID=A8S0A4_ENTBW|nr:hypothetical protein CLOBOL_05624 [Enterocloster bolteae ATCC BAA-613]